MTRSKWRLVCVGGLAAAAVLSGGCDDLVHRSVRDGLFTYVSGGISNSLNQNGAISNMLSNLFTGSLFTGGTGGTGTTSGT
jgi:hypothetical protein